MMQEDAPPWAVLVILAVRGSAYETRAASAPSGRTPWNPGSMAFWRR